jgi:hypothetical protein
MSRRQYCADNLFLLGAAGYISLCDEVLNEEDKPMVETGLRSHPSPEKAHCQAWQGVGRIGTASKKQVGAIGRPEGLENRAKTTCSSSSVSIEN